MRPPIRSFATAAAVIALCLPGLAWPSPVPASDAPTTTTASLSSELRVGDLVFIRIDAKPFREVADATGSWTNHVGVVVGLSDGDAAIAESTVPWSRTTTLSRFVARSHGGRIAVARLHGDLTPAQQAAVVRAAARRSGIRYDTGFDLHSRGQFCSRYVREVLLEATGIAVGEVETFARLLSRRPDANVGFWKAWYLGSIPWQRETVTPASVRESSALHTVFDGVAVVPTRRAALH